MIIIRRPVVVRWRKDYERTQYDAKLVSCGLVTSGVARPLEIEIGSAKCRPSALSQASWILVQVVFINGVLSLRALHNDARRYRNHPSAKVGEQWVQHWDRCSEALAQVTSVIADHLQVMPPRFNPSRNPPCSVHSHLVLGVGIG